MFVLYGDQQFKQCLDVLHQRSTCKYYGRTSLNKSLEHYLGIFQWEQQGRGFLQMGYDNVGSNGVQYHKAQLEHSMTCIVSIIHFQFCIVLNCIMVGLKAIINNIINNICDINFVTDHKYLFRVVDISI